MPWSMANYSTTCRLFMLWHTSTCAILAVSLISDAHVCHLTLVFQNRGGELTYVAKQGPPGVADARILQMTPWTFQTNQKPLPLLLSPPHQNPTPSFAGWHPGGSPPLRRGGLLLSQALSWRFVPQVIFHSHLTLLSVPARAKLHAACAIFWMPICVRSLWNSRTVVHWSCVLSRSCMLDFDFWGLGV